VFPPEVRALFDTIRAATRYVVVSVPPQTRSTRRPTPADPRLRLVRAHRHGDHPPRGGGTIRTLPHGPVADSVDVSWNGKDSADAAIGNGRYAMRVIVARPGRANRRARS